jgi:hypothetical protein
VRQGEKGEKDIANSAVEVWRNETGVVKAYQMAFLELEEDFYHVFVKYNTS